MLSPLNVLWYLISGGIVLLLPGLAWIAWFPNDDKDVLERLSEAIGISISLTALVALAGFLGGWHFSSAWMLFSYGLMGLLALCGLIFRARLPGNDLNFAEPDNKKYSQSHLLRNLVLIIGLAAILAWRFYQVRDLVLPAWVDSLHHVLIVQVILGNGGVPATLEPLLPVPFYYHFGFHVLAAAFTFWSGLPSQQAVLVIGQVLNAGVALSIYRLGMSLWKDWRRAGTAALLTGFVSQMPAYYVTWGRYTLLTGLVLLPLAMAVSIDIVHQASPRRRQIISLGLLTAGVLLAHYFAAVLLALFLVFLGAQALLGDIKEHRGLRGARWLALVGAAGGGAALASPWILRVWHFSKESVRVQAISPAQSVDAIYFPNYLSYLWRMAGPNRNYLLLALALLGLIIIARRSRGRALAWWTVVLGLISLPWGIHMNPFRPDHAVIILFLPVTLLAADFLFTAGERIQRVGLANAAKVGLAAAAKVSLAAALLSMLAWGVWDTRDILNQTTVLASEADLDAIRWIEGHTPADARFFINVTHWQYGIYRGVDGGWWINLLTGRETLLPPVMYALGDPEYYDHINALAEQASKVEGCTPEFKDLIEAAGLTYVYLGSEPGVLRPDEVKACPYLSMVYQQEGVSIYRVVN
jgi:hypothetical protein